MKTTVLLLFLLGINFGLLSQNINTEISEGQRHYLLGEINKIGLQGQHYASWFNENYEDYKPNKDILAPLKQSLSDYEILVFMGTWCGDSKREVPRFLKVLDMVEFPQEQLKIVAVSRTADLYKQSPNHEEAGLNIHRVPTFILYRKGKEVNRIVEEPVTSLEQDLLDIISTTNYQSHYAVVHEVDRLLKKGPKKLKKREAQLLRDYRTKVSSIYELNTYAKVLYYGGRIEDAITVQKLNTKFYPQNPKAYANLSDMLSLNNQPQEAQLALEKAISLDPDNKELKGRLTALKSR